ncbi:hypothetical protein A0H81_06569 [Grifola frondosa]|uniref:Uncharacterized protein n=1 Tax=Grifola frondosa TaxID=5627 RepID=A0A1C7M9R0_GRIFR|nr:hypothetical protein A0H81_06569 [Grifola frondosa]
MMREECDNALHRITQLQPRSAPASPQRHNTFMPQERDVGWPSLPPSSAPAASSSMLVMRMPQVSGSATSAKALGLSHMLRQQQGQLSPPLIASGSWPAGSYINETPAGEDTHRPSAQSLGELSDATSYDSDVQQQELATAKSRRKKHLQKAQIAEQQAACEANRAAVNVQPHRYARFDWSSIPVTGWPAEVPAIVNTDPMYSGEWSTYVPHDKMTGLAFIKTAQKDHHAQVRVMDLIKQIQEDLRLSVLVGLQYMFQNWQNPESEARRDAKSHKFLRQLRLRDEAQAQAMKIAVNPTAESSTAPTMDRDDPMEGFITVSSKSAGKRKVVDNSPPPTSGPAKKKCDAQIGGHLPQPRTENSIDEWISWYLQNPARVPAGTRTFPSGGWYHADLESFRIAWLVAPRTGGTPAINAWAANVRALFSICGLFDHIMTEGNYPHTTMELLEPFPSPATNTTIFDVARWFAHVGISTRGVKVMEEFFPRHRNLREGHAVDAVPPYDTYPCNAADITIVLPIDELIRIEVDVLMATAVPENTTADTTAAPSSSVDNLPQGHDSLTEGAPPDEGEANSREPAEPET